MFAHTRISVVSRVGATVRFTLGHRDACEYGLIKCVGRRAGNDEHLRYVCWGPVQRAEHYSPTTQFLIPLTHVSYRIRALSLTLSVSLRDLICGAAIWHVTNVYICSI